MIADLFGAEVCFPPDGFDDAWDDYYDMAMADLAAAADDAWNEASYD